MVIKDGKDFQLNETKKRQGIDWVENSEFNDN